MVRAGRAAPATSALAHAAEREQRAAAPRCARSSASPPAAIQRNVKGCWNLGSCGMGCPTNAKQSMLVTTIPAALDRGATLLVQTRAVRFELGDGDASSRCSCVPVAVTAASRRLRRRRASSRATIVVAGGAINSPALLLRSDAPDPHARARAAHLPAPGGDVGGHLRPERVEGWDGAPQTIYTDHFLDTHPIDGPIGYKLEAPPMHPVIFASTLAGFGREQAAPAARSSRNTHALLALLRDGFHPQSPRRPRAAAQRRLAGARLPAERLRDGRRAARAAQHGRDPVRRRRADGLCRCTSWRSRYTQLGRRRAQAHRRAADEAAADARRQRARDGRLRHGRRRASAAWCGPTAAIGRSTTSRCTTARCSRPASAPIRSSRSTASSTGWPRGWRDALGRATSALAA